jgi:hypothetical protein
MDKLKSIKTKLRILKAASYENAQWLVSEVERLEKALAETERRWRQDRCTCEK